MSAVDDDADMPHAYDRLIMSGDCVLDAAAAVLHIARNHWLFSKPQPSTCMDRPVIVVGSGPSLDEALPRLRECQRSCYIIAAHSALQRLLAADIEPHAWAPVERIPVYTNGGNLISGSHPRLAYAGLPIVPDAAQFCGAHWLVPNVDPLYAWLGCHRPDIAATSGTGVHAAFVGAALTTAPVYLVGNDLAAGHFAGYQWKDAEDACESVLCVDGVERPMMPMYGRMRREMAWAASRHTLVQVGHRVATIPGAQYGDLPAAPPAPPVVMPSGSPELHASVIAKLRGFGPLLGAASRKLKVVSTTADITSEALAGDHAMLWASIFGSVYVSVSSLRRTLRWSDADAVRYAADAMLNAIDGLSVVADEVSSVA